jgi:hypothetical protein
MFSPHSSSAPALLHVHIVRDRPVQSSPVQSSRPSHINNAEGTKGVKSVTQYQLSLLVHSQNQHNSNMESIKSSISLPNHKKRRSWERLQGLPKKTSSPSRNTSSPPPKVSSNFIFPNNNSGLLSSVVMPFIESFSPTLPC